MDTQNYPLAFCYRDIFLSFDDCRGVLLALDKPADHGDDHARSVGC
ncbi:hypothetical Protein YC6258_01009 [Gynuella sunshinyii YC6258]|uniref:Uncharacterized protein n=1 Tax=Gynuella sunshinyii YC6258 TaxID=1445510 RepID=A0A0C5VS11_9GAMM|nr:hypothetical Protein YC6258_01009 [Gynuella sunshinyii YC6258]